jgi:glycosyltransferase involved in cell wall biosynthesis
MGIEIQTNHDSLIASLESRSNRIRGIWIQRISVANTFFEAIQKKFPSTPIIFDTIDLLSNRIRSEQATSIKSEMKLNEAIRLEEKFTAKSSITLTVSDEEKEQLQSRVPSAKIETLWMSFESISESRSQSGLQNTGLFVGNFRHTPNKVSLEWFIKDVLPRIHENNADFVLNVIGTGLSPTEIASLHSRGVNFLGFVDNLEPMYLTSKVVVVPLQYGAGIKGKMCEALSHSSALVSTSYGAEGLGLRDGIEYLLANDSETFAHQVLRVLEDEKLRSDLSEAAMKYANANLSAESFTKKIKRIAEIFE